MNTLLHREGENDLDELSVNKDREINLGTTMILGIFFALAVLCAVFFGFGYSMGRKSAPVAAAPATMPALPSVAGTGSKPGAGSPVGSEITAPPVPRSANAVTVPYAATPAARVAPAAEAPRQDSPVDEPVAPATAKAVASSAAAGVTPVLTPGGLAIVQVAAVSHQEDADLLVTTLKRRGYSVAIHSEPQDKLMHVQVGPFATHKEADAMRQKLLADGFNAIVKDNK